MAPLTGKDFHNPDLTGPRASHNIPSGGLFSAYASTTIHAPPEVVYDAILNVGDWKKWNSFVYDVKITKNPNPHESQGSAHKRMTGGTCMIFYRNLSHNPPEKLEARQVVTLVEKLKTGSAGHSKPCVTRIRWMLDNAAITTPGFLLKCERINEIEEAADGTTVYRTWEVFSGPIARTIRKKFEVKWKERLQDMTADLKKWCERRDVKQEVMQAEPAKGQSVGGQPVDGEADRLPSQ